jgi:hypothetical protein
MSKEQNFDNSKKALHIAVVSKCLPIKHLKLLISHKK